jgi:hypothetical protein
MKRMAGLAQQNGFGPSISAHFAETGEKQRKA